MNKRVGFINHIVGAGGRQTPTKRKNSLHRLKFYLPTKDKVVLIRARSKEAALDIYRKYHGSLDEINMRKIRSEEVRYDDGADERKTHNKRKNTTILTDLED